MPQPLHIEVIRKPHPDAEREAALAVEALAEQPDAPQPVETAGV